MANNPTRLKGHLEHHWGRRQPVEDEESSLRNPYVAWPSRADQEATYEMQNAPAETSRPAEPSRGSQIKPRANKGRAYGKHTIEESGDTVQGGEDAVWSLSRFEVDRHPTKVTEWEMDLIRELYQVPDYVEFRLPGPSDQPTRPHPGHVAMYKDYFFEGLQLPLHSFFKEALLNLDVSLPQLNLNAAQSLVALWVLYRVNYFPDLTLEEFRA